MGAAAIATFGGLRRLPKERRIPLPVQPTEAAPKTALPDLGDTRTAFAAMSDRDLWQAQWLFRVIGDPALTAVGSKLSTFALALHLPVKGLIKATIFNQFCGGETIEESLKTATRLGQSGVGTILDHSVEGQEDDEALDHTTAEILRTIQAAQKRTDIPFCVFKPSGISPVQLLTDVSDRKTLNEEDRREWTLVLGRMEKICAAAAKAGVPVLIDAEESWMQPAIDDMADTMMARFNTERAIVFNTIQLYRHDRLAFLKGSHAKAVAGNYHIGVKLVRGAYMEKERARAGTNNYRDPIHVDKAAVDRDYDDALRYCAAHLDRFAVCVGTHNEQSTLLMARLMNEQGLPHSDRRIWFAQLLGMSDNISFNMAAAGYNVAKYVPYGPVREVLPYLIRRANENTSARGQTGRELGLILAERKRRAKEGR
ncbi:MAG: proline dehydrogenase family protein [Flavobacteriales bacterium]|nr:proline dehydrogenase family protein [Flavobacteriales bacterium]